MLSEIFLKAGTQHMQVLCSHDSQLKADKQACAVQTIHSGIFAGH